MNYRGFILEFHVSFPHLSTLNSETGSGLEGNPSPHWPWAFQSPCYALTGPMVMITANAPVPPQPLSPCSHWGLSAPSCSPTASQHLGQETQKGPVPVEVMCFSFPTASHPRTSSPLPSWASRSSHLHSPPLVGPIICRDGSQAIKQLRSGRGEICGPAEAQGFS